LLSILHKLYQIKNGEINDATNFYTTIKLYLRRTLVLQQFYSAIVGGACPRRSEGIFSFYLKRDPQRFKKRLFDLFNFKKITAAGKDPVTTVPAAISILLLIMRKNINTNFIILLSTCAYRMVNNEYNQATKTL